MQQPQQSQDPNQYNNQQLQNQQQQPFAQQQPVSQQQTNAQIVPQMQQATMDPMHQQAQQPINSMEGMYQTGNVQMDPMMPGQQ